MYTHVKLGPHCPFPPHTSTLSRPIHQMSVEYFSQSVVLHLRQHVYLPVFSEKQTRYCVTFDANAAFASLLNDTTASKVATKNLRFSFSSSSHAPPPAAAKERVYNCFRSRYSSKHPGSIGFHSPKAVCHRYPSSGTFPPRR